MRPYTVTLTIACEADSPVEAAAELRTYIASLKSISVTVCDEETGTEYEECV